MKKGFTIIELLVASMLLGMLVTILTMIFNQSSIAWRTGTSNVADLAETCEDVATLSYEADNAVVYNNHTYLTLGMWDLNGKIRDKRPIDSEYSSETKQKLVDYNDDAEPRDITAEKTVSSTEYTDKSPTYVVNVMSAGPDRKFETYDDIWSVQDDFE